MTVIFRGKRKLEQNLLRFWRGLERRIACVFRGKRNRVERGIETRRWCNDVLVGQAGRGALALRHRLGFASPHGSKGSLWFAGATRIALSPLEVMRIEQAKEQATMIKQVAYQSWRELPLSIIVDLLDRLQAGVIYCPQHFPEAISHVAFAPRKSDDRLVSAIEGLDLAMTIAEDLAVPFSIYSCGQATIRGIRRASALAQRRAESSSAMFPESFRR